MAKPPVPRQQPKPLQQAQQRVIATQWQGPLPSPESLSQFNDIVAGGAERIFKMVEDEQAHRIAYEKKQLEALIRDTRRGHYIGLVISLVSIGGAITTALMGQPWQIPVALVGLPILGVITEIVNSKTK